MPYSEDESSVVLFPVPWEATTSYGGGASKGPEAILEASKQVDLFDVDLGHFFERGIFMQEPDQKFRDLNNAAESDDSEENINRLSDEVNTLVYGKVSALLGIGKTVGLVGGDHSSPFGCIRAHLDRYPDMGLLQIDAHMDLREAYEGFRHSHASIMFNVVNELPLKKLVQVGIRDICEAEHAIASSSSKISTYYDQDFAEAKCTGSGISEIVTNIISDLPDEIYISFDIDGLDPSLCPHTGTPVPGGLSYQEMRFLLKEIKKSGKKIVGFDLCEVAPRNDEWDANVGSRVLFSLIGYALASQED